MKKRSESMADLLPSELDALWQFALRLSKHRDEAKDLVQQTCLRALEQQERYRDNRKLRSWLFCILHNVWINRVRSRDYRDRHAMKEHALEPDVIQLDLERNRSPNDSSHDMDTTLLLSQVYEIVQQLPESQRHVVELVCVEGFSYRETADILNVKPGTVMSRLARARLKIGQSIAASKISARESSQTYGRDK